MFIRLATDFSFCILYALHTIYLLTTFSIYFASFLSCFLSFSHSDRSRTPKWCPWIASLHSGMYHGQRQEEEEEEQRRRRRRRRQRRRRRRRKSPNVSNRKLEKTIRHSKVPGWHLRIVHCLLFTFASLGLVATQCDQIGLLLKGLGENFHTQVAQIFGNFLGFFEKHWFSVKTVLAIFAQLLGEIWLLLL